MAAACPLLWCPLGLGAALLGVTMDSVDVATMVALVPAVTKGYVTRLVPCDCVHVATAGSTNPFWLYTLYTMLQSKKRKSMKKGWKKEPAKYLSKSGLPWLLETEERQKLEGLQRLQLARECQH